MKSLRSLLATYVILLGLLSATPLCAQHWTKVFQLPEGGGSCAFFLNATTGFVGTGNYLVGREARIYRTTDGGRTWQRSHMESDEIQGQVTDIFFRDPLRGWATVREKTETGYSGVYRTLDGGLTWHLMVQSGFPAGVRETKRGVFYTERDINGGVYFSADLGLTWKRVAATDVALGIDWIDDQNGFVTTQAIVTGPHLVTRDGGVTWNSVGTNSECWTVFGDPVTRTFYLASERDNALTSTQTALIKIPVTATSETALKYYEANGLTGGIAGGRACTSVLYAQGRKFGGNSPQGLIRSMDGGMSWLQIGGPMNIADTRFAVTGRGAVVFACDSIGGVFRTLDGGDGLLSPSVLPQVTLRGPVTQTVASLCDSVYAKVVLGYKNCDSIRIANVTFLNDAHFELAAPLYSNSFGYATTTHADTLRILYKPNIVQTFTAQVRVTLRQPDGYLEDTLITINFRSTAASKGLLSYAKTTQTNTIDFDSVSLCVTATKRITLTNLGCADVNVTSLTPQPPFRMKSVVTPFVLSPGTERTFLIEYKPTNTVLETGRLVVLHDNQYDSLLLRGTGYEPNRPFDVSAPAVSAALCDSQAFEVTIRNAGCITLHYLSSRKGPQFIGGEATSADSMLPGEQLRLPFVFKPLKQGTSVDTIHITLYSGSIHYDTTITIVTTGTSGKPDLALSTQLLDFGNRTICASAVDTVIIWNPGCGDLSITSAVDDAASGFTILRGPRGTLAAPEFDTLIVLFTPNATLGIKTANLVLTSSAGTKSVALRVNVTNDPGSVALSYATGVQAYTCETKPFFIHLDNATCDPLTIVSVSADPSNEFAFSSMSDVPFPSSAKLDINGTFTPKDSLVRTANVTVTFRRSDGSTFDSVIRVSATGLPVRPFIVSLGSAQFTAGNQQKVMLPVYLSATGAQRVSQIEYAVNMNTDLLSPVKAVGTGQFAGAAVTKFDVRRDSVIVRLELASDIDLSAGEFCTIECLSFVAASLVTPIRVSRAEVDDRAQGAQCIQTVALDSSASFTLDPICAEPIISHYMATREVRIESVTPNPTHGAVTITLEITEAYQNNGTLEVLDERGTVLSSERLMFKMAGKHLVPVALTGEGVRYLRIQTPSGVLTTNVILLK